MHLIVYQIISSGVQWWPWLLTSELFSDVNFVPGMRSWDRVIKLPVSQIQGLSKGFVKTVDTPHCPSHSVKEAHSEGLELNLCHLSISSTPSSLENDLVRGKPFDLVVCPPLVFTSNHQSSPSFLVLCTVIACRLRKCVDSNLLCLWPCASVPCSFGFYSFSALLLCTLYLWPKQTSHATLFANLQGHFI